MLRTLHSTLLHMILVPNNIEDYMFRFSGGVAKVF